MSTESASNDTTLKIVIIIITNAILEIQVSRYIARAIRYFTFLTKIIKKDKFKTKIKSR